jgi:hypothetical protein
MPGAIFAAKRRSRVRQALSGSVREDCKTRLCHRRCGHSFAVSTVAPACTQQPDHSTGNNRSMQASGGGGLASI